MARVETLAVVAPGGSRPAGLSPEMSPHAAVSVLREAAGQPWVNCGDPSPDDGVWRRSRAPPCEERIDDRVECERVNIVWFDGQCRMCVFIGL